MNTRTKNISRYVIPSVAAMIVSFLYIVVDGIFVGRGVGAHALAAVNIAVPFTTLATAFAGMIAIGGSTITAIRIGRGDKDAANESFLNSMLVSIGIAALITALGVLFPLFIARVSGASTLLLQNTADYIRYYCLFSVFNSLSIAGNNFCRNDGKPGLAFWAMISGAVANIFLDWLFVFPLQMGIKGAAIASGLGQILSLIIMLPHFLRGKGILKLKKFTVNLKLCAKIMKRGLPEFITQLSQPVTIFCYNYVVMNHMGEMGVAAYSIICYVITIILGVFIGVSEGIQPLIGYSFGSGNKKDERFYFRAGLIINLVLSALIYLLLLVFGSAIFSLFNTDKELIALAYSMVKIYGLCFILASVNIIFTTYFFSTKNTSKAIIIAGCRSLVFNLLFILAVPLVFGPGAMWYAVIFSELLTVLIAVFLLKLADGQAGFRTIRTVSTEYHTTRHS